MFARRQKKSAKSGQAAAAALLIKETLLGGQTKILVSIKGIVSRDFEWLQMILMARLCIPDVPLEDYSSLNFHLHIVFLIFKFTAG